MRKSVLRVKKTVSVLLSVLILFSSLSVASIVTASASSEKGLGTISFMEETYQHYKGAVDKISADIKELKDSTDISEYQIPPDSDVLISILRCVVERNPDIFYFNYSVSYSYNPSKNIIVALYYSYDYDKSQITEMKQELEQKTKEYLSKIDDSMTDFEKALVLHDELVLNHGYNSGISIYEFMVEDKGQCIGYVHTYTYLLSLVGIDSEIVESDEMNHAWCKVKLDGNYYNVDPTFDDPTEDRLGHVSHSYFLLSDEAISSGANGIKAHTGYTSYYKANSTKYDNFENLHAVDSRICCSDGKLYAVYNASNSEYSKALVSYNEETDKMQVLNSFDVKWSAGGNSYWVSGFMGLDRYDGILYMNTDNSVYYYEIESGKLEKLASTAELEGRAYGLIIKDEQVYVAKGDNPYSTGEWVLVGDVIRQEKTVERVKGDINGDGKVTVLDIVMIQKQIAGSIVLDSEQLKAADINGDGNVSVLDATMLQKFIAGSITF